MAGELFDMYALGDGADEGMKRKALADALRARIQGQQQGANFNQAWGNTASLSGDKVLGNFGQQLQHQSQFGQQMAAGQEDDLARAGQYAAGGKGRMLEQAIQRSRLAKDQREAAEESAPANSIYGDLAKKFGTALPAGLTNKQARDALLLAERAYAAEQMSQARNDAREDTKTAKREERIARDTKDLSEDAERMGLPGYYQKETDASRVISAEPDDLPGFGYIAGHLPEFAISQEGVDLRHALGGMLAEYRKGITGAGMSDAEREEYSKITGLVESGSERSVKLGVDMLRRAMDARTGARAAGTPEAAQEYGNRQKWFRDAVGRQAAGEKPASPQAQPAPQISSAADFAALPSGAEFIDPKGVRRRKP